MNTKLILGSIVTLLLISAAAHAQNWGGSYSSSYTGPNGRTTSYNQSYSQGAGGWMGTGCPQGVGWAIFAVNAARSFAANQPISTPVSIGANGGGYYGGGAGACAGGGYGYGGGAGYYVPQQPTYRAGYGVTPY